MSPQNRQLTTLGSGGRVFLANVSCTCAWWSKFLLALSTIVPSCRIVFNSGVHPCFVTSKSIPVTKAFPTLFTMVKFHLLVLCCARSYVAFKNILGMGQVATMWANKLSWPAMTICDMFLHCIRVIRTKWSTVLSIITALNTALSVIDPEMFCSIVPPHRTLVVRFVRTSTLLPTCFAFE